MIVLVLNLETEDIRAEKMVMLILLDIKLGIVLKLPFQIELTMFEVIGEQFIQPTEQKESLQAPTTVNLYLTNYHCRYSWIMSLISIWSIVWIQLSAVILKS